MTRTALDRDNLARVRKNRARIKTECNSKGRASDGFSSRERDYAKAHPHLLEQLHCGLYPDSARPTRAVKLPNGLVLHSSWYKVPTTDADSRKDYRDNQWLLANGHHYLSDSERVGA